MAGLATNSQNNAVALAQNLVNGHGRCMLHSYVTRKLHLEAITTPIVSALKNFYIYRSRALQKLKSLADILNLY